MINSMMNLAKYHKMTMKILIFGKHYCRTMTREFKEFALDGHNYRTCAMEVKISLALRGVYEAIVHPEERIVPLLEPFKYNASYIIRNHLHTNSISEYLMEEEQNILWAALQACYEQ
jgi:hypothetical protein